VTAHLLTDADLDSNQWASCGPCSLAALFGRPLVDIHFAFPRQRVGRTWTSMLQMREALEALRVRWSFTGLARYKARVVPGDFRESLWPSRGIAHVQFRGSWDTLPMGHAAQLQRSHWIAVAPAGHRVGDRWLTKPAVFDVNLVGLSGLEAQGGWTSREMWEREVSPMIAKSFGAKATGEWWVRAGIEITL